MSEDVKHYAKVIGFGALAVVVITAVLVACFLAIKEASYVDPTNPTKDVWWSPGPPSGSPS